MLSISSSCRHTLNGDCLLTECTQCHHRDDGWGRARGRITLAGAAGKRVRMHACTEWQIARAADQRKYSSERRRPSRVQSSKTLIEKSMVRRDSGPLCPPRERTFSPPAISPLSFWTLQTFRPRCTAAVSAHCASKMMCIPVYFIYLFIFIEHRYTYN